MQRIEPLVLRSAFVVLVRISHAMGWVCRLVLSSQEIQLDKKVKLLDCPGVIFDNAEQATDDSSLLLKNCISVADMEDPESAVEGIVRRCNREKLMELYEIAHFASPSEFLRLVAIKRKAMKPGGIPDKKRAARSVLQDWNLGKVPFFTIPPETDSKTHLSAKIVEEWSKVGGWLCPLFLSFPSVVPCRVASHLVSSCAGVRHGLVVEERERVPDALRCQE